MRSVTGTHRWHIGDKRHACRGMQRATSRTDQHRRRTGGPPCSPRRRIMKTSRRNSCHTVGQSSAPERQAAPPTGSLRAGNQEYGMLLFCHLTLRTAQTGAMRRTGRGCLAGPRAARSHREAGTATRRPAGSLVRATYRVDQPQRPDLVPGPAVPAARDPRGRLDPTHRARWRGGAHLPDRHTGLPGR